jgi:hypothetical protein
MNILAFSTVYSGAIFYSFELTTNLISGGVTEASWGYGYTVPDNSLLFWTALIWLFALGFLGLAVCVRYYLKERYKEKTG